jgi:DNA-binding GntR family transcriptional regulator
MVRRRTLSTHGDPMSELAFVRPVDAVSVADRVANELRSAIISGRLQPEQEFSLRQIASELGVSFIPVREALRSLEAEGLLITHRGRSATVAPMSADEVTSMFRLRRLIEPELAELAATRHQLADLDRLEHSLAYCNESSTWRREHPELLCTIHVELLRPSMTSWDSKQLEPLVWATGRYLCLGFEPAKDPARRRWLKYYTGERALLEALRAGRPDEARVASRDHLDAAEDVARCSVTGTT